MSIDIDAKLIIGCEFDELFTSTEELEEAQSKDAYLTYASPWYDSASCHWIVGYEVLAKDLEKDVIAIAKVKSMFENKYGVSRIFITPDVS